jgi:transcriptional regulator with XRE-family HTH domain
LIDRGVRGGGGKRVNGMKLNGTRLKAIREKRGLTQKTLANKTGITKQTISNIETGSRGVSFEKILAISEALNVNHEYLVSGGEEGTPKFVGMAKPKTITEQIQEIAEDFCIHYCKYPDTWDEEREGCELSESDICSNCPIGRF